MLAQPPKSRGAGDPQRPEAPSSLACSATRLELDRNRRADGEEEPEAEESETDGPDRAVPPVPDREEADRKETEQRGGDPQVNRERAPCHGGARTGPMEKPFARGAGCNPFLPVPFYHGG